MAVLPLYEVTADFSMKTLSSKLAANFSSPARRWGQFSVNPFTATCKLEPFFLFLVGGAILSHNKDMGGCVVDREAGIFMLLFLYVVKFW